MSSTGSVRKTVRKAIPYWFRHLANHCARPLINVVWPLPPAVPDPPEVVTLKREVKALSWFHSIDLGHGIITPGCEPTAQKLRRLGLPEDLTGRTVLDVGAYDGFFSFEAERRGAARAGNRLRLLGW